MEKPDFANLAIALTILVLIDLVATSIWFNAYGIQEANPLMAVPIERSTLDFAILKLSLSLPGIWILYKYCNKKIAKIGLAMLTFIYFLVTALHYIIFININ